MEAADDGTTEATIDSIIAMTNQQEIPAEPGDDEEVNVWQVREVMIEQLMDMCVFATREACEIRLDECDGNVEAAAFCCSPTWRRRLRRRRRRERRRRRRRSPTRICRKRWRRRGRCATRAATGQGPQDSPSGAGASSSSGAGSSSYTGAGRRTVTLTRRTSPCRRRRRRRPCRRRRPPPRAAGANAPESAAAALPASADAACQTEEAVAAPPETLSAKVDRIKGARGARCGPVASIGAPSANTMMGLHARRHAARAGGPSPRAHWVEVEYVTAKRLNLVRLTTFGLDLRVQRRAEGAPARARQASQLVVGEAVGRRERRAPAVGAERRTAARARARRPPRYRRARRWRCCSPCAGAARAASFRGGGERPSSASLRRQRAAGGAALAAAGADAARGATAARRSAAISATVDSFRFGAAVELRLSPGWRCAARRPWSPTRRSGPPPPPAAARRRRRRRRPRARRPPARR